MYVCGGTFSTETGMKVHMTKKGCVYSECHCALSQRRQIIIRRQQILARVHPKVPKTFKLDIAEIHDGLTAKI